MTRYYRYDALDQNSCLELDLDGPRVVLPHQPNYTYIQGRYVDTRTGANRGILHWTPEAPPPLTEFMPPWQIVHVDEGL